MRKIFLLITLLLCSNLAFAKTKIDVLKVYDGDSILAKINDNIFRIRLIDIDCFEGTDSNRAKWQAKKFKKSLNEIVAGGNLARNILENKLKNKEVYFSFQGIDKYNRALGYLYTDNRNINDEMAQTNYCTYWKPKNK